MRSLDNIIKTPQYLFETIRSSQRAKFELNAQYWSEMHLAVWAKTWNMPSWNLPKHQYHIDQRLCGAPAVFYNR